MSHIVSLDEQIMKSRRVLAAWQWMSKISNRPDEVVRLLNTEARLLAGLAMAHPEKAATVAQLIDAYKRLACAVQQRPRPRVMSPLPVKSRVYERSPDIV